MILGLLLMDIELLMRVYGSSTVDLEVTSVAGLSN